MVSFQKYLSHPYAEMFPLLTGIPFDQLKDDIKQNGQKIPAIRYKGRIIDGRNRIRACLELKIKPRIEEWHVPNKSRNEETQILEFIVSMNLHRRQLTPSQRAMIASDYFDRIKAEIPEGKITETREDSADTFGVSKATLTRAEFVKNYADRKNNGAIERDVRKGDITIHDAIDIIHDIEGGKSIDRVRQRRSILFTFRRMLTVYAPHHKEFQSVWEVIRKQINKIAESYK